MKNTSTITTMRRRGIVAIEQGLRRGHVTLLKRDKPVAVLLSVDDYAQLMGGQASRLPGQTAMQWLLAQPSADLRSKQDIDEALHDERSWQGN